MSLWSGAGGLDLGLAQAGFDVAVAADHDEWACRTHGHNSDALVFCRDLDDPELTRSWLRDLDLPQIALVAAGFPCQPYSRAGSSRIRQLVADRQRSATDPRAFAWRSFVAAVEELRPTQALAENVPDLARYNGGQLLRDIVVSLEALGYEIDARILPARQHGVPQYRERLIIQAALPSIGTAWPETPTAPADVTLESAIGDLPEIDPGHQDDPVPYSPVEGKRAPAWAREGCEEGLAGTLYDHICRGVREDDLEAFEALAPGGTYLDIPEHLRRYDDESFTDKYKRLEWDRPSRTITAHIARDGYWYIHPEQHRTLSIREAARVQTFPDWYVFAGFPSNRYVQIGNAVPPRLGRALGLTLLRASRGEAARSPVPQAAAVLANAASERGRVPDVWPVLVAEAVFGGRASQERVDALLQRLPTIKSAAGTSSPMSEEESVAAEVARDFVRELDGRVPETADDWQTLPRVTATISRMLQALTVGDEIPVSAGTLRVAERVSGVSRAGTLNGLSQVILARLACFGADTATNHLLVEIGRTVCRPDDPACERCPMADVCLSARARPRFRSGTVAEPVGA